MGLEKTAQQGAENVAPIRILNVIGGMSMGGAETMLMNLFRRIDRSRIQFDFLVHKGERGAFEDEILSLGGKIYRIDKFRVWNHHSYTKQLQKHFSAHPEHKIVHCHIGSSAAVCLHIAKKYGAITIAHSHNTRSTIVSPHSLLWNMVSFPTRYIADYYFACSEQAAIDRFGNKVANSERCYVIHNGIDCQRFKFDRLARERVRKELNIENNFVVGHIGRHSEQKNPMFLLEVFAEVYRRNKHARLLQVGQGELTEKMKNRCQQLEIDKAVIFAGAHLDVEKYYSAMDVLLFPSLWEGLPVTLVEAQTNGLCTVVSGSVSSSANMGSPFYHVLNLSDPASKWAEEIVKYDGIDHLAGAERYTIERGFDVEQTAQTLTGLYGKMLQKQRNDA